MGQVTVPPLGGGGGHGGGWTWGGGGRNLPHSQGCPSGITSELPFPPSDSTKACPSPLRRWGSSHLRLEQRDVPCPNVDAGVLCIGADVEHPPWEGRVACGSLHQALDRKTEPLRRVWIKSELVQRQFTSSPEHTRRGLQASSREGVAGAWNVGRQRTDPNNAKSLVHQGTGGGGGTKDSTLARRKGGGRNEIEHLITFCTFFLLEVRSTTMLPTHQIRGNQPFCGAHGVGGAGWWKWTWGAITKYNPVGSSANSVHGRVWYDDFGPQR